MILGCCRDSSRQCLCLSECFFFFIQIASRLSNSARCWATQITSLAAVVLNGGNHDVRGVKVQKNKPSILKYNIFAAWCLSSVRKCSRQISRFKKSIFHANYSGKKKWCTKTLYQMSNASFCITDYRDNKNYNGMLGYSVNYLVVTR